MSTKVRLGICAMEKKSRSVPMREITRRMEGMFGEYIDIIFFTDEQLLKWDIKSWPSFDALLGWYSDGFPLDKAKAYQKFQMERADHLKIWFNLNDFDCQEELKDRSKVYKKLKKAGIDVPKYCLVNRKKGDHLEEFPDYIKVNGITFTKPFVEKPRDADSHDIRIYFHSNTGGGYQQLFRKVNNRSSSYQKEEDCHVRNGEYIYEEFIHQTHCRDIKVYAVGKDYAHSEARKSPALDGFVERNFQGKEIRYPVILTTKEKQIASKIVNIFQNQVCGFDILRSTDGKSYVCDVNGFSFVKSSEKYFDDAARVLASMILEKLTSQKIHLLHTVQPSAPMLMKMKSGVTMELRCILAVMRHGERTPKQKKKMVISDQRLTQIFNEHKGDEKKSVKLKRPSDLQDILTLVRIMVAEETEGNKEHRESGRLLDLIQIREALERHGRFSGIHRKVQIKHHETKQGYNENGEVTVSRSLLLIAKWGGELTDVGRYQAELLGNTFQGNYPGVEGKGFLRLHSTNRNDLKICASDEGRVRMTAAAFAKGLLALEGELPPILTLMISSASKQDWMLDDDNESLKTRMEIKKTLKEMLNQNKDFDERDMERLNPCQEKSIQAAAAAVKNPWKYCQKIHSHMKDLTRSIDSSTQRTRAEMKHRWTQLMGDFRKEQDGKVEFDISKIPDIYDNIRYDFVHNKEELCEDQTELLVSAKYLNTIVVPQEYGITKAEKISIARRICNPLIQKLSSDLEHSVRCPDEATTKLDPNASSGIASPLRHVRTRLYVTSESHIHALLNLFIHGDFSQNPEWENELNYLSEVPEYSYLSRLVIVLYEDPKQDPESPEKYVAKIKFSPGLDEGGQESPKSLHPTVSLQHIQHFFGRMTRSTPHTSSEEITSPYSSLINHPISKF